jgi:hypothetical protein
VTGGGLSCYVERMRPALGVCILAIMLGSSPAAAEDDDDLGEAGTRERRVAHLELGAGGHVGYSSGNTCARIASDVVGCQGGNVFAGLTLAPRWRFDPAWSLGATGAASWADGVSLGQSLSWWRVSLEARWHPQRGAGIDPWLGLDAGVVALVQDVEADELGPDRSYSGVAPALGASFGLAIPLADALALGFDLRGFLHLFGGSAEDVFPEPDYENESGLLLQATAIFLAER